MADKFAKQRRSEIMSSIRGRETKPEKLVRSALFRKGFRFRKNVKSLPGKPDIVLKKYGAIIFVNGCFWHGHTNCRLAKLPLTNTDFWTDKIQNNAKRDRKNLLALKSQGWSVITVWQCQINSGKKAEKTLNKLFTRLNRFL